MLTSPDSIPTTYWPIDWSGLGPGSSSMAGRKIRPVAPDLSNCTPGVCKCYSKNSQTYVAIPVNRYLDPRLTDIIAEDC